MEGGKAHPVREVRVVTVAGDQRLGCLVPQAEYVLLGHLSTFSEGPLHIVGDSEFPRPARIITQFESAQLDGSAALVINRHEDHQLLLNRVAVVLEHRVAGAVSGSVGLRLPDWLGGWTPEPAGLFIPDVDHLRGRVEQGIV